MFFRLKKTPSGHVLQLLQSYRNPQGQPRQQVVVSLGNASIAKDIQPHIARGVTLRRAGQPDLLSPTYSTEVRNWIERIVRLLDSEHALRRRGSAARESIPSIADERIEAVLVDRVDLEGAVELGPELLGLYAWRKLGMDEALSGLGINPSQRAVAAVSVISRLCMPCSELALAQWVSRTALPELMGQEAFSFGVDRFYRVSDALLRRSRDIEQHLVRRQADLFDLDQSILLYDLTNTHFEGVCAGNPKAKRGKNKQKRNDCPQIVVGMVFDGSGFELTHRVFEGSRNDSKTLAEMVRQLQSQVPCPAGAGRTARPLVIVDGGIATADNLGLLREKGYDYLVNDSRRGRGRYALEFSGDDRFTVIEDRKEDQRVSVRMISETHEPESGKKYTEQVVLCKSAARGEKERAILSSAEKRFLKALSALRNRISEGRLKDAVKIQQAIGRLKAQHPRVHRYYTIEFVAGILRFYRQEEQLDKALELSGCYVLRTNRQELDAPRLWRLYMTLQKAEEGFRFLKSDLGLRPNFHQKECRVEGHVFITILAYQLLCFIRETLRRVGIVDSWKTIRRLLGTHCYATMVLPTKNGKTYRIRKASAPDEQQDRIYQIFGIDWRKLPKSRTLQD